MLLIETLLPEFDHEIAMTKRVFERIPNEALPWKPHQKSMSLGVLATHISTIPHWATLTFTQSEFNIPNNEKTSTATSQAELLVKLDQHSKEARSLLVGKSDAELMAPWSLKYNRQIIFTMPKASFLRKFVFSHLIHHRGQLSVYLRLKEVPIPSIYGASADEKI